MRVLHKGKKVDVLYLKWKDKEHFDWYKKVCPAGAKVVIHPLNGDDNYLAPLSELVWETSCEKIFTISVPENTPTF